MEVNGRRSGEAAWSYPDPTVDFSALKDHLAFYAGSTDGCYLDGEKVQPQPGSFYGGWITADIRGPWMRRAPRGRSRMKRTTGSAIRLTDFVWQTKLVVCGFQEIWRVHGRPDPRSPRASWRGVRQCGKTSLLEHLAPRGWKVLSLDDFQLRSLANRDPALFFDLNPLPAIIDEIQFAANLFPEIKRRVDRWRRERRERAEGRLA